MAAKEAMPIWKNYPFLERNPEKELNLDDEKQTKEEVRKLEQECKMLSAELLKVQ